MHLKLPYSSKKRKTYTVHYIGQVQVDWAGIGGIFFQWQPQNSSWGAAPKVWNDQKAATSGGGG